MLLVYLVLMLLLYVKGWRASAHKAEMRERRMIGSRGEGGKIRGSTLAFCKDADTIDHANIYCPSIARLL